jgi:hypothetical protein
MVFERELFLAKAKDKPPFFGICYPEHVPFGTHENTHLIGDNLEINLFVFFKGLNLSIMVERVGFYNIDCYTDVKYDRQKLYEWLHVSNDAQRINFGHVRKMGKGIQVERTFANNKLFVTPVKNLYLMNFKGSAVLKMASM